MDKTNQKLSPLPKLPDWGVAKWNTIFCQFDDEALPDLSKELEAWADMVGCHLVHASWADDFDIVATPHFVEIIDRRHFTEYSWEYYLEYCNAVNGELDDTPCIVLDYASDMEFPKNTNFKLGPLNSDQLLLFQGLELPQKHQLIQFDPTNISLILNTVSTVYLQNYHRYAAVIESITPEKAAEDRKFRLDVCKRAFFKAKNTGQYIEIPEKSIREEVHGLWRLQDQEKR
ncbi:MAG: hypothetical protein A3K22_03225 [Deltaproteobacteria bacterium RBG_16_42_7]|nr:MAG: hypothetical protein A3K22_03225 [Deltaproteobacteria bacterium RBG_16_42_7]